jgi:hypothetical protein
MASGREVAVVLHCVETAGRAGIEALEARAWDLGTYPPNIPPACREGEPEFWRSDHTISWEDNMAGQYSDVGATALGIKVSREHMLALLPEGPREPVEELGQTQPAEPELLEPTATPISESPQSERARRYIQKHFPNGPGETTTAAIYDKLAEDKDLRAR